MEKMVPPDPGVPLGLTARMVLQALMDEEVPPDLWVALVCQEPLVPVVKTGHRDKTEIRVQLVHPEHPVLPGPKVVPVPLVQLV